MFKPAKLLLISGLATLPAIAFAASVGDVVGTSETEIRANLEAQGYTITEFEIEGDEIEVEAIYEGQEVELELAGSTGKVLEIETDEDDDDD